MPTGGSARSLFVKHVLTAIILALFLPILAQAGTITFLNTDGTAGTSGVGVDGPFTLKNSGYTSTAFGGITGKISFSTGSTFTGSLSGAGYTAGTVIGSWNATGSSFDITETGTPGYLFQGEFTAGSTITWTFEGCNAIKSGGENCNYAINGFITGTYKGTQVSGATVQLLLTSTCTTNGCSALYNGGLGGSFIKDQGGTTDLIVPTPEPGSLSLMGSGLIGAAFAIRRRLKGQA